MSAEFNNLLEELAATTHNTKSEVIRRAVALMDFAVGAKKKGESLGVFGEDDKLKTKIVGL